MRLALITSLALAVHANAADIPRSQPFSPGRFSPTPAGNYSWSVTPVGNTAELVTLNCRNCTTALDRSADLPLLSVLRDTLGTASPETSRLTYLWLLNAAPVTLAQRLLSAVPFFYWPTASSSPPLEPGLPRPLLNLNAPLTPVIARAGQNIVQWAALDPLAIPVRAASRSYRSNRTEYDRLHLEQAIVHLQNAPAVTGGQGLTEEEIDTLVARLELRKTALGGLLANRHTAAFGAQARFEAERVRIRNWDAMRQFAEKTGTLVEELPLGGSTGQFAILWLPVDSPQPVTGVPDKPIWKLLNIRDPWSDPKLLQSGGLTFQRAFDAGGRLLPEAATGARTATVVPLAVYSLSYPQMPLLLVDFRDRSRIRRREILGRAVTELTDGVIGISFVANWYFYAGEFAYKTIWSRTGVAADQANRLDCYTTFRAQLTLDRQINPVLRHELLARSRSLSVNPLDSDPARNVTSTQVQFARLEKAAGEGALSGPLDRERRAELAAFGASTRATLTHEALHILSFGAYTRRAARNGQNLSRLERDRRISYQLAWLNAAVANGTDPRITLNSAQIEEAVTELQSLLGEQPSGSVQQQARVTFARLRSEMPASGEENAKTLQATANKALK